MRSSLASHQPITPMSDDEIYRMARRLYHEKRIALIDLNEVTDTETKRGLIAYADRKYGERR